MQRPWDFDNPLCAQIGDSYFFLNDRDEYDPTAEVSYEPARKICNQCEHKRDCAEWAVKYEDHGFWGGLSPRQRQKIRSRMLSIQPKQKA